MSDYKVCKKLILENVNNDSRMKAIALYHLLRCNFVNSKVYNLRDASKQIKISEYLLKKLVPILVEMGMATWVDSYNKRERQQIKVLSLSAIDSIKERYKERHKTIINIDKTDTLKDLTFKLKAICIKNYLEQQEYVYRCKADLKTDSINNVKQLKKLKAVVRSSGEVLNGNLLLSSRKARQLFGINSYDFKPFRIFTEGMGWKWIKRQNFFRKCCYEEYLYSPITNIQGYRYWTKGCEVIEFPYSIHFS